MKTVVTPADRRDISADAEGKVGNIQGLLETRNRKTPVLARGFGKILQKYRCLRSGQGKKQEMRVLGGLRLLQTNDLRTA